LGTSVRFNGLAVLTAAPLLLAAGPTFRSQCSHQAESNVPPAGW
jgi:hypothetical protein